MDIAKAPLGRVILGLWNAAWWPALVRLEGTARVWYRWTIGTEVAKVGPPSDYKLLPVYVAPSPAPTPAPTTGNTALVRSLIGPHTASATTLSLNGQPAQYESLFARFIASHAAEETIPVADPSWYYYDRALVLYAGWARTGSATLLSRAHAAALIYRKWVEASKYGTPSYWTFVRGLAIHFLLTGDEASRTAVGRLTDNHCAPYYLNNLDGKNPDVPEGTDPRTHARILDGLLVSKLIAAPSPLRMTYDPTGKIEWGNLGGNNWAALLPVVMTKVLATQAATGDWAVGAQRSPFMYGLLNDVLADIYTLVMPDVRIVPAVKRNTDFMWSAAWKQTQKGFLYNIAAPTEEGGVTQDLNMLIAPGYAFVGDKTRALAILDGMLTGPNPVLDFLAGPKQFNQNYCSGYRVLA